MIAIQLIKLTVEAMIRLYQSGRIHAYINSAEGANEEFRAAMNQVVAELRRIVGAVASLFEEGSLGGIGRDLRSAVQPLLPLGGPPC